METPLMPSNVFDRWFVKIKHIVPTLVYIIVGSVLGLMTIRWLLIQTGFEVKEETRRFVAMR